MSSLKRASVALVIAIALALVVARIVSGGGRPPATAPVAREGAREDRLEEARSPLSTSPPEALDTAHEAEQMVIAGLVTTADGKPVSDATVTIATRSPIRLTTELDGTFGAAGIVAGTYDVTAQKGDLVAGPARVSASDARSTLILKLHGAPALRVHVVDASTGAPIAGAAVVLTQSSTSTATSDASGDAAMHAASAGEATLSVQAEGYAPAWRALAFTATQGGMRLVSMALERGAPVRGRVVDGGGRGVEGARVVPAPVAEVIPANVVGTAAVTGPDGRFQFDALSRGVYRFSANAPSFAPAESALARVSDRGADGIEIRLEDEGRLAGFVVLSNGAPASHASLRIARHGAGHARASSIEVEADAEGRFEARALPRAALDVVANHGASSSAVHRFDLGARAGNSDARIVVDADRTIKGVVVNGRQQPVGQVYVTALPTGDDGRFAADGAAGLHATTSREGGEFTITGLREGRYTLRTWWGPDEATRGATVQREGIDVSAGARNVMLVVRGNGAITGSVRTADGRAVGAYQVGTESTAASAFDGDSFRLDGVTAGSRTLRIAGATFATKTIDVEVAADATVDVGAIVVDAGRTIRGRVVDARGMPVAAAKVLASPHLIGGTSSLADASLRDAYRIRSTTSGADGTFVLTGLDDTPNMIAAESDTAKSIPQTAPAGDAPIELALVSTGRVQGRVTGGAAPVSGAMVGLLLQSTSNAPSTSNTGGSMALAAITGADGGYAFDAVPPGHYLAYVSLAQSSTPQKSLDRREIDVQPNEPTVADFHVQSTGIEVVLLADPIRQPNLRGADVLLSGGTVYTSAIGAAGSPVLSDVAPGDYHLCVIARSNGPRAKSDPPPPAPRCHPVHVNASPSRQEIPLDE